MTMLLRLVIKSYRITNSVKSYYYLYIYIYIYIAYIAYIAYSTYDDKTGLLKYKI